jgi:hypothetical protein
MFHIHAIETRNSFLKVHKTINQFYFCRLRRKDNQSYNGIILLQFSEASELDIVNTFNCCDGFYTRILNDQRSAIDYVLMSKGFSANVSSDLIDEKDVFDLNSNHFIISVKLRESFYH